MKKIIKKADEMEMEINMKAAQVCFRVFGNCYYGLLYCGEDHHRRISDTHIYLRNTGDADL